jgi:hypothetical protein
MNQIAVVNQTGKAPAERVIVLPAAHVRYMTAAFGKTQAFAYTEGGTPGANPGVPHTAPVRNNIVGGQNIAAAKNIGGPKKRPQKDLLPPARNNRDMFNAIAAPRGAVLSVIVLTYYA